MAGPLGSDTAPPTNNGALVPLNRKPVKGTKMQHYLTDGRSSTYLCGVNAWGRRNTRTDCDENQTICRRCLDSLDHPSQQTELNATAGATVGAR